MVVFNVPFAFAFGAGMIATVNPCGFAMLPSYLGFFVGTDASADSFPSRLRRALAVSAAMTLGFVAVFAVIGFLVQTVASGIDDHLSKVTVGIGVVLVLLGLWLLSGRQIRGLGLHLDRGGRDRSIVSMFVYGVSYAVASLSCTLGPFLVALTPTFRNEGTAAGMTAFIAYALGMGTIVTIVTVLVSAAEQGVVASVRDAGRWVNRISGGLLVVAGVYVTWYGIWELDGSFGADPVIDGASRVQTWLTERVDALPKVPLAIVFGLLVLWVAVRRVHRGEQASTPASTRDTAPHGATESTKETTSL